MELKPPIDLEKAQLVEHRATYWKAQANLSLVENVRKGLKGHFVVRKVEVVKV